MTTEETRRRWALRARAESASAVEMRALADRVEHYLPGSDVVARLRAAAGDEAHHAALCDDVVDRLGPRVEVPAGSPGLPPVRSPDPLVGLLEQVTFFLCAGEAIASRLLVDASEVATVPGIPELLRGIAVDESRHWSIGWAVLDGLLPLTDIDQRAEAAKLLPAQAAQAVVAAESMQPAGADGEDWGLLPREKVSRGSREVLVKLVCPRLRKRGLWGV